MLPISVEGHVGTSAHAPTGRVWVFSNEDSNLGKSPWGAVPQSQYGALSGITHLIPPLGSSTSPWNRGTRWM